MPVEELERIVAARLIPTTTTTTTTSTTVRFQFLFPSRVRACFFRSVRNLGQKGDLNIQPAKKC
jgi:hypothetical protein